MKKAKQLGMTADPGPEVEGYVDRHFQDEKPAGQEIEVVDPAYESNLPPQD